MLYLIFNEDYQGDVDLVAEAIRLTRQLGRATAEPEVSGLLALMLLHHARRPSRFTLMAPWCPWPPRTGGSGTPH